MSFESLWNGSETFELPEEPLNTCPFANKISTWSDELLANCAKEPIIVLVNQMKVLLLDQFFSWRQVVPKSHRNRIGEVGHRCIFHVFEEAYQRLKTIELELTPPLLFLPPPPTPPQLEGIFIGELEKPSG